MKGLGGKSFGALVLAVTVASATTRAVAKEEDRRDKAKEAKELAEKGQQYAVSKAAEYFAQQQYDKGMQEIGQMMQDAQSRQKNQTAKEDTTAAGRKGRGDGRGQRGSGESLRPTADVAPLPPTSPLEERLKAPEPAPRAPKLADDTSTSDDGGSSPPPAPEPSDGDNDGADRKPAEDFLKGLRELRADHPTETAPAGASPPPASGNAPADGRVALDESAVAAPAGTTADATPSRAASATKAPATDAVVLARNWGTTVAAASSQGDFDLGEEEEEEPIEGKKVYRRLRRPGARGATERNGALVAEERMPPARDQILDPRQMVRAKH